MLSKKEKEELLEDGYSLRRRKEFILGRRMERRDSRSLDDFIRFLAGLQKVFFPFANPPKATITRFNKL